MKEADATYQSCANWLEPFYTKSDVLKRRDETFCGKISKLKQSRSVLARTISSIRQYFRCARATALGAMKVPECQ